jgi:Histone methylation protein DOT1
MASMTSLREELADAIALAEKMSARHPEFASRAEALAFLDAHVFDRLTIQPDLRTIETLGRSLQRRLETANSHVIRDIRDRIVSKHLAGPELARTLIDHAGSGDDAHGYDPLDLLVGLLLDSGEPNDLQVTLEKEMVAYQPTPARAILEAIEEAPIRSDDVFCDLGSGLGWVTILVALITGARCKGIELEPAYVDLSRRAARALGVTNADFFTDDLLHAPLSEATIYFSYTPLRGALLQTLIERLHAEAMKRPIRICTLGPCTQDFLATTWLMRSTDGAVSDREIALFRSVL